jgi:hypothetical protein
MVLESPEA